MKESQIKILFDSVGTGFGLAKSSSFANLSPKIVSEKYLNDNDFRTEYEKMLSFFVVKKLSILQRVTSNEFRTFRHEIESLANFKPEVVLWESLCKKDNIKNSDIVQAYNIHKNTISPNDVSDASCSIGLSEQEFLKIINTDDDLSLIFTMKKVI